MTRLGKTAFFGPFALDLETGELRKDGVRIRLQNQPFQILRKLVENPGRVVTREDLRRHLWPEDTFVDFESGLNTAANRLRLALSDSAEDPRYVETLPRVGYRFIASVEYQNESTAENVTAVLPVFTPPVFTSNVPLAPAQREPAIVTSKPARPALLGTFKASPWSRPASALLLFLLGAATPLIWTHYRDKPKGPSFTQLTFRRGSIDNAQFTPDGEVVFSAEWNEQARRIYVMNVLSPESRPLDISDSRLAAVSRSSQITFIRDRPANPGQPQTAGELSTAPIFGGAPHAIDRGIEYADWSPGGLLCVVRTSGPGRTIEYPVGKTIYQTVRWLGRPRVSPDGKYVAVVEHALRGDDAGYVLLIGAGGKVRRLSPDWASIRNLAWSAKGDEVWFAAAEQGINRQLYAINLEGRLRRVAAMPAVLDLFDIAPSGKVLIGRSVPRLSLFLGDLKTAQCQDISWLDWSRAVAVSANGNSILFDESGEGGGPLYTVYLYRHDRGTTERFATGRALDLSPDADFILTAERVPSSHLTLIDTNDTKRKMLQAPGFTYQAARFIPHSRDIVVQLSHESSLDELYLQNIDTGTLRRLNIPFNYNDLLVSPGGQFVAGAALGREVAVFNLRTAAKSTIPVQGLSAPVGWVDDNNLILASRHERTLRLEKFALDSGKRQLLKDLPSSIIAETKFPIGLLVSADLSRFVFSKEDESTGLFAVDGWS